MKSAHHATLVLSLALLVGLSWGDFGPCTFGSGKCSCRMGSENQGKCWDHRTNTPGTCAGRFCLRGWTCSCSGRTHLCDLEQRQAIVIDAADKDKEVAPCPIDTATGLPGTAGVQVAAGPEISLGSLQFDISPLGSAADDCNQGEFL